ATLAPLLRGALSLSGETQTAGLATATAAAPHGFTVIEVIMLAIAGGTGSSIGYNGTFPCTIASATQFTYTVSSSLPATGVGTFIYTPEDVAELTAMNATFFAQGSAISVYVLELGGGDAITGITALNEWIVLNPGIVYSWLVPHNWGVNSSLISALATNYNNDTAKTYFHITTTAAYQAANPP